jgi:type II secretory pathway pseudopilin PulG
LCGLNAGVFSWRLDDGEAMHRDRQLRRVPEVLSPSSPGHWTNVRSLVGGLNPLARRADAAISRCCAGLPSKPARAGNALKTSLLHPRDLLASSNLRRQQGYTLVELLVAMSLTVVVLGGIVTTLVLAARVEARDSRYAYAQDDARVGLDRMVNEIRQAVNIVSSGPNFVDMNVDLSTAGQTQEYQVYYECDIPQPGTSYNECVRVQAAVGASLPSLSTGDPVITNLQNGTATNPVFTWAPSSIAPYYMTATIDVPASHGRNTSLGMGFTHTVVISDGALMRNLNVQN